MNRQSSCSPFLHSSFNCTVQKHSVSINDSMAGFSSGTKRRKRKFHNPWNLLLPRTKNKEHEAFVLKGKSLLARKADPRIAFWNSHQLGKSPSNAPGTSSTRMTPTRGGREDRRRGHRMKWETAHERKRPSSILTHLPSVLSLILVD